MRCTSCRIGRGRHKSATKYASSVNAVIIKAIGDWEDGSEDYCRGWKLLAACAAAYYVKEMLSAETFD